MTSSLVGSEMCIRDRPPTQRNQDGADGDDNHTTGDESSASAACTRDAVSYTHLTLPTICSV
eukprot:7640748-Prorocentrum_lima.AAC.1